MDNAEYELLRRVEAGEAVFHSDAAVESPWPSFAYVVARLLQLGARGLVRFAAAPTGDYYLAGPCHLTPHGRAMLELHRLSGSEEPAGHGDASGRQG